MQRMAWRLFGSCHVQRFPGRSIGCNFAVGLTLVRRLVLSAFLLQPSVALDLATRGVTWSFNQVGEEVPFE